MHSKIPISVIILTKNSQKYLKEVLNALKDFEEVLIIDNGSKDATLDIAKSFKNVKIFKEEFIGFDPLKNRALKYAKNDWVLYIDSDEILTNELAKEIKNLTLNSNTVYALKRDNYYKQKLIKCCGWNKDFVLRLFNRKETQFNNNLVHESLLKKDLKIKKLKNPMRHYSFEKPEELIEKMNLYSTLYAQNYKKRKNITPLQAFLKAAFSFFKNYFLQKGFLCGYEGLLISISNANGVFYKYIKLYEKNKQ